MTREEWIERARASMPPITDEMRAGAMRRRRAYAMQALRDRTADQTRLNPGDTT